MTHAIADDLARMAAEIDAEWRASFADHLLNPGPSSRYLTLTEARQALLTTLITGLEFNKDARLGRPLGSFDKPHPERAEAATSGRSTRNLELSLVALRSLARSLHQPIPGPKRPSTAFLPMWQR
ncbi:imelysin family protein [Gemmobacter lanyuensis]